MKTRFVYEELTAFSNQSIYLSNLISGRFDREKQHKIVRILGEWLHLQEGISISFLGPMRCPEKSLFVAAFASQHQVGGLSLSTFFARFLVNLSTKQEQAESEDFDRGFLGLLFADIADALFADAFPGTQLFLDTATLENAEKKKEEHVFVFQCLIQGRSDFLFLHLPETWPSPKSTHLSPLQPQDFWIDLPLSFPVLAGQIPLSLDAFGRCSTGDLLIPDHAIDSEGIEKTYPYAQVEIAPQKTLNVELNHDSATWTCTFLTKELSMDDSITNILANDAQVHVKIVVGEVEIALKNLASIQPGFTLELNRAVHEGVDLVAQGQIFAKGELVNVGGKLGVRIVSRV